MSFALFSVRLQFERDVVSARRRTREAAEVLGFDAQQQTRLATAVSEIARNALVYAGGGTVEFSVEGVTSPQLFSIVVTDRGGGIANADEILEGRYRSATGMGMGIVGAQRLMDQFALETSPAKGTKVALGKLLPRRAALVTGDSLAELIRKIARQKPKDPLEEFRDQNQELLRTLDELRNRQDDLIGLNRELEDTNRGVVALYAELDEKADHLRRADEMKSRFLSDMSHEFRTPLNSILALARLLLERTDGELSPEQEIQVGYIRQSAECLFDLVNDLLDLAKVEAGKTVIHPVEFDVADLFGALRGMLRPLLATKSVNLIFEELPEFPRIFADEGKVSQILRNFIVNALKFTETGEVRISAVLDHLNGMVIFHVKDTGIGIAPEHRGTIFQEFVQVDGPIQRRVNGTGLGLPLSKKLAELLGGAVTLESELGHGSVFSLRIPRIYRPHEITEPARQAILEVSRFPVLLVEDRYETRLIYEKFLRSSPWRIISARTVREAENILRNVKPVAIVLDIMLRGEDGWDLLARLKSDRATRKIPVLVATAVEDRAKAMALGADVFVIKPLSAQTLRAHLEMWTEPSHMGTVLLVDDEDISRYLLKQLFNNPKIRLLERSNAPDGIQTARAEKPDLIVMDLSMPGMTGFEAIDLIQADPQLKEIQIIVATSKVLTDEESRRLKGRVLATLSKERLSEASVVGKLREVLASVGLQDLLSEPVKAVLS